MVFGLVGSPLSCCVRRPKASFWRRFASLFCLVPDSLAGIQTAWAVLRLCLASRKFLSFRYRLMCGRLRVGRGISALCWLVFAPTFLVAPTLSCRAMRGCSPAKSHRWEAVIDTSRKNAERSCASKCRHTMRAEWLNSFTDTDGLVRLEFSRSLDDRFTTFLGGDIFYGSSRGLFGQLSRKNIIHTNLCYFYNTQIII